MKKIIIIVLISILNFNCSSVSNIKNDCIENLAFKKDFFLNIENVENLLTKNQNQSFHNSLRFISKYTKVSWESMLNYSGTYPVGKYRKDKQVWLKWYEDNKCNNIQFK